MGWQKGLDLDRATRRAGQELGNMGNGARGGYWPRA
jgi:hypothetical protein